MAPKQPVVSIPASPPLISLLSSAEVINEPDSRWEAGIEFESESCGLGNTGALDPCASAQIDIALGNDNIVSVDVFGIFAGDSCSSFGAQARDFKGRARRKLAACESRLIEEELWSGAITQAATWTNPFFTDGNAETIGTAMGVIDSLACLEQAITDCTCGRGMIHATLATATHWVNEGLIKRYEVNGKTQLQTELGTIVVPGAGYDGSGPDGEVAVDGAVWAYATSMIAIRMSPVIVIPDDQAAALNRALNILEYRAERLVAVAWDCCQLAVSIDHPACNVGS